MARIRNIAIGLWRVLTRPMLGRSLWPSSPVGLGEDGPTRPPLWRRVLAGLWRRMLLAPVLLALIMVLLVYGTTHRWTTSIYRTWQEEPEAPTPSSVGLYYRDVQLTTSDGVTLRGWYIPVWSAGKFVRDRSIGTLGLRNPGLVLCHDAWADRAQWLHLAPSLHAAGYELMLLDLRGCGQSDGQVRLGLDEWQDVEAAIAWLQKVGAVDAQRIGIVAAGTSSSAALRVAAMNPSVRAVAVDRPCRTVGSFIKARFAAMHLPGSTMGRLYEWSFALSSGADLTDASAQRWAGELRPYQSLLVTARTHDPFVPLGDPLQVLEAAPGPRKISVVPFPPGCPTQPALLPRDLVKFLAKPMASKNQPSRAAGV